jgi:hypothetical protein
VCLGKVQAVCALLRIDSAVALHPKRMLAA